MAADQAYGSITEGVHIAGYSLERAFQKLEWLLEDDRWKSVGDGFDDVNAFLATIKFDSFRIVAEQRKKLAKRIKELTPEASNRTIAKTLGAGKDSINRDVGASAPVDGEKTNNTSAAGAGGGANAPSGEDAAKIVKRKQDGKLSRDEKHAKDAARVSQLTPIQATFTTLTIDPPWDYGDLSLAGRDGGAHQRRRGHGDITRNHLTLPAAAS